MTVDWLAGIPSHWQALPLRYVAEPLGGLTFGPEDISDAETGTLVLRSSNIQNGSLDLSDQLYVDAHVPSRMRLKSGDILVCSRNGSRALIGKNAAIPPDLEGQTFGAFMTVLRSGANNFLYWVLNSPLFEQQSATFLTSTINQLTLGNFKSFTVPYPPEDERKRIADFLDHETAQIDKLIGKQERLIELLAEKRQAIVAQAVTKGLDPSAPTKPSGVPWLGDVPRHWKLGPVKHFYDIVLGKMLQREQEVETDIFAPFLKAASVKSGKLAHGEDNQMWFAQEEVETLSLRAGDILVVEGGSIGQSALVENDIPNAGFEKSLNRVRPKTGSSSEYFQLYMTMARESGYVAMQCVGATFMHLTSEKLGRMVMPVPPPTEQVDIAVKVGNVLEQLARASERASRLVELLRERRSALISAAVTGKIDLREGVA